MDTLSTLLVYVMEDLFLAFLVGLVVLKALHTIF